MKANAIILSICLALLAGCSTVKAWRVAGEKLAIASERLAAVETRLYTQTLPCLETNIASVAAETKSTLTELRVSLAALTPEAVQAMRAAKTTILSGTNTTGAIAAAATSAAKNADEWSDTLLGWLKTTVLPVAGAALLGWVAKHQHGKRKSVTRNGSQPITPREDFAT